MNTTKHTPGPWSFDSSDLTGRINIRKSHANGDARILAYCWKDQNGEANASLIAAAPDLLEALRFLLADYIAIQGDKLTGSSVPIEKAKAAIAKAEGNL